MGELANMLKDLQGFAKEASGSAYKKFDRATYQMLIEGLKASDPEAVKVIMDQLVKEGRALAIPPLFLVSKAHGTEWVRMQAQKALNLMVPAEELAKIAGNGDMKAQVKALIDHYGNYRQA